MWHGGGGWSSVELRKKVTQDGGQGCSLGTHSIRGAAPLSQIPVEGRVINCCDMTTCHFHALPWNNRKTIHTDDVPCSVAMFVNGEGALRCILSMSPKVLPYSILYSSSQPT